MKLILMFWRGMMLPSSSLKELGPNWLWWGKGKDVFWYVGRVQDMWPIRRGSGAISRTVGSVKWEGWETRKQNSTVPSQQNDNCDLKCSKQKWHIHILFLGSGRWEVFDFFLFSPVCLHAYCHNFDYGFLFYPLE